VAGSALEREAARQAASARGIPTPAGAIANLGIAVDLAATERARSATAQVGADTEREEARRNGVEFMWYSPTPLCIFNPIAHQLGNKGCAACDGLLSVSPAGDVLPCSSWPEPVGNLLREPFRKVWDSARGRWLREKRFAPETCRACDDFVLCQSGCPLYWRHFGYAELGNAPTVKLMSDRSDRSDPSELSNAFTP
jgi:radical SAM protein with 4Fe4S-binding SPASM domain